MIDEDEAVNSPRVPFAARYPRSPQDGSRASPEETVGSGAYKPYGFFPAGGAGEACDIRQWTPGTDIPEGIEFSYRLMLQIAYSGDDDIRIHLPDCVVAITGSKLLDLRKRLMRRTVTFIQQYNPRIWPTPPRDEPIIETIEIVRPDTFRRSLGHGS